MNKGKESKIGRKWRASRWEGMDKIERNTDNYENLKGCFPSTLNLVSPLFLLRSCQIHSFSLFASFHLSDPGLALQILPQLDFFLPLYAALDAASSLHFTSDTFSLKCARPFLSLFAVSIPVFIFPVLLEADQ